MSTRFNRTVNSHSATTVDSANRQFNPNARDGRNLISPDSSLRMGYGYRADSPPVFATSKHVQFDFYIMDEIDSMSDYAELIHTLATATETEDIVLHINCYGGSFLAACQIAHAIQNSKARVIASAEGIVASAATMIFLACNTWDVSEFSTFMFHTSTGGAYGKAPDNKKTVDAHLEHLNRVCRLCYDTFFTEEEIDDIINANNDVWLTPSEVRTRLTRITDSMDVAHKAHQDRSKAVKAALDSADLGEGVKIL